MQAVLHNNPITFDEVKKSSCYIFRYNLKYGGRSSIEFLTLSCPAVDCPNRVFSRNPMEDGRAGTHLKRCGLSFQDQGHMVCLYARPGMLDPVPSNASVAANQTKLLAVVLDTLHISGSPCTIIA
jgi:hypothetical protein